MFGISVKKLGKALKKTAKVAYKPVKIGVKVAALPAVETNRFALRHPGAIPLVGNVASQASKAPGARSIVKVTDNTLAKLSVRGTGQLREPVFAAGNAYLQNRKQQTGYKVGLGFTAQGGTLQEAAAIRRSLGKQQRKGYDLALAAKAGEGARATGDPRVQFKARVKAGVKVNWWHRFLKWVGIEKPPAK